MAEKRALSVEKSLGVTPRAPRVTVIVPVYNTERYLEACLDSLVNQTFSDIEILCVDDGSTDSSGAMLDARAARDARIRVIHQSNAGVSHARNVALDAACGEYILFVDSDDFIDLDTCEKLLNIADRDGADIVVFGGVSFPSVGWIDACFDTHDAVYRNDSFGALFYENGSHPLMCNKMYRRSLLNDNGLRFNETFTLGEDNAFQFCTFPRARVISYCRDTFYHYRCEREGSAVNAAEDDRVARLVKHVAIVEYVVNQWAQAGFLPGQEERLLSWSSEFLSRDILYISQADRMRFAQEYRRIADEHGLMVGHSSQAPYLHDLTDFVRAELSVSPETPTVSVIAVSCYDETCLDQGFVSLANQYLQDVELLCVDAYPDRPSSVELKRLVASDERARLVGTVGEALRLARGSFVICAHLRDHYDWYALRDMVQAARGVTPAADVVTVRDWFNHLRTQDLTRSLHMLSNDGTKPLGQADRASLAPAELGDDLLSFSSLDASNKLWRTDFARSVELDFTSAASVALALMQARTIVPLPAHLMRRGSYKGITVDGARNLARKLGDDMAQLYRALEEGGLLPVHEKGYVNAYLSGGMCLRELMRSDDIEQAFLESFAGLLRESRLLDGHDKWWFVNARDYECAQKILSEGVRSFLNLDRYDSIEDLSSYINVLESQLSDARREIGCLRGSMSFRVGRAATKIPRRLVDLLHRLRR
ncbi:MAG: glycosyltransferase family 2 protein [Coriobacteriia bacterium]|nr:glycosyltransferase family 2 protein [Coriobacteriia bacterium]